MFKKSLASLISMAIFAAGPVTAAAQTMARAVVGGVNATPMIVNSLQGGVQVAPVLNRTTLSPSAMTMSPALAPTALATPLTPAAKITAVAPAAGSPLTAIQSEKVADKAPALKALFDQSSLDSASDASDYPTKLSAADTAFLLDVKQYLRKNSGGIGGADRANDAFSHRIQLTASDAGTEGLRFEIHPPAGKKGGKNIEVTLTMNGAVMVDPLRGILAYDMTGKPRIMSLQEAIAFVNSELPGWRQWLSNKQGPAMPTRTAATKGAINTLGNSGIAGGAIFDAVSKFKKENSARILAIKGVSGVSIGTAKGPISYAVLLIDLDGTVPQAEVDAAIKKLPGYDGNFVHIKYETMGPIAAQTGPALQVSIKIEIDYTVEGEHGWPAGTMLGATLDILKESGFKIKGKAKKIGADVYVVYGEMTAAQIKALNEQDFSDVEITVLKKSAPAAGQGIISETELNSLFSRWKPNLAAKMADGLNKGPALPSQTVPVIERESLPKSSVLRKKTEKLDSQWGDDNIMSGSVGALSGRFKSAPSDIQISVAAKALLITTFAESEGRELENSASASAVSYKDAVETAVINLAEGFNYDKSNVENLNGLRKQVKPLAALLGKSGDIVAISAKSTTMDESSDPAASMNVGLILFANKKTGEYVAFYARQANE